MFHTKPPTNPPSKAWIPRRSILAWMAMAACWPAIAVSQTTLNHADHPTVEIGGGSSSTLPASSNATRLNDPTPVGVANSVHPDDEIIVVGDAFAGSMDPSDQDIQFALFPEEHPPLHAKWIERVPDVLTLPAKPLASFFARVTHAEHDEVKSELDDHPIGLKPIPSRPPLVIEWNEKFLSPGWLSQGIEMPGGAVWRPSLWVFGQFRSAIQYFDSNGSNSRFTEPVAEWANRLDLFGQVNLSGTERLLIGIRPLDEENGTYRDFSGYAFRQGQTVDGWNSKFQTLFFEGDFGEVFPFLDPYDVRYLDLGFSVGRMPLLAQQGLLINEDAIDAVTLTRNTVYGAGNLNLRMTGVYAWDSLQRNSPSAAIQNDLDPNSQMFALLTESDFVVRTVNLDAAYVSSDDARFGDLFTFGVSAIRRHGGYHNTYNTSVHFLASFPTNGQTDYAQQGELLFAQTSWTPHHTHDLIFLNTFWAIDQFTSATRGPLNGGALGQTGILYSATGIGRHGAPLGVRTDNVAGASLGYQMFFDHTRQQIIWEIGGFKETKGPTNRGAIATGLRYQKAFGQHFIFILDGFVAKREGANLAEGGRAEILIKF